MSYNPNSDGRGRRGGWRGQSCGGSGGYQNDRNYYGDYQQGLGQYSQEPNYVPVTVGRLNVADEEASTIPPQQYQKQQRRGEFGGRSEPGRGRPYQQRHQPQGHGFEHLYRDGGGTRNQRSVANPFEGGYSLYGRELVPEPGRREDSGSSRPEEPNTTPVLSTATGFSVKFNGNTSRLQGRMERMSTEDMAPQDREQNRPERSEQEEKRPRYRGGFGQRESQQDKHQMGIPQDGPPRPAHDRGYNRYQADKEQNHGYQGGYEQRGAPPDRPQTGYTRGGFTLNRGRGGFRPGNQEVNEHDGDRVSVSQKRQEPRALAQTVPVYQKPHWQLQMEARRIVKVERKKQGILEHRKTNKKAFAQPETRKYENGVNGEGRSGYELGQKIPTFSDEEKEKDGKTCEHLHKIITKNDLTVDELLLAYLSVLLKKEEEPVLKTSEELVKFLENHGHVFLQKLGKSTIANRGFGYRRCMVYICCIILSQESDGQGVKISDVFDEIEALPTYTFEGPWNDDWIWNSTLTKTHLIKFFSQHSEIFELDERDGTVKITGSAKQVPTLWDSTILSLRPSPSKKEVYWDFSRVENFRGYVFATVNEYCCVRITAGYFKNRHVYCLASDMDLSFERFALLYPTGFEVVGSAHFTMHAKNEFRCLQLKVINPDTGLELVPRKPEVEEEEGPVITSKEEKDLFEKVHMRSVEEEDIVDKLDELIGVKKVKWDELEERRKNIENDENYKNMTMFSSADSLKTAFLIRPHLYKIHTLGVAVYSQEERDFKLRFLHHVCRVSTDEDKRLTMEELAASFGTKAVEEKLAQFTEVEKLEVAIKKLNGILEMKADAAGDPWTLLCFVDGVYYSKHKAFLPKFSPFV